MQYPAGSASTDLAAFSRFLKILYFTLFASLGLYWLVVEMLAAQIEARDLGPTKTFLGVLAVACGAIVLFFRFSRIAPLLADSSADLSQRLARLRFHYIVSYTLAEAVALYGFVVRMLGGAREEAVPFFVGAVALFLLCYPRLPQTPGDSMA